MLTLTLLVSILAGAVGIPAVSFLKGKLGWSGDPVKFLAAGVSAVLAIGLLAAACVLPVAGLACVLPLSLANAVAAFSVAFSVGQLLYAALPHN